MTYIEKDEIRYSDKIKGDSGNYNWQIRLDADRGYLGITQWIDGGEIERVLLSPKQLDALLAFLRENKRR